MTDNLDMALKYISKGKPVFACNVDKSPKTKRGFIDATLKESQIRKWFTDTDNSIGIPTGKASGWLVLDVDFPNGPASLEKLCSEYGPLPETMSQQTGSGAKQYFFRYPDDVEIRNSASKIGPGLDIRGEGGYSIVPPSGHPSGGNYKWLTNGSTPLADLPGWLKSILTEKPKDTPSIHAPSEGTTPYGRKALESETAAVALAPEGQRNHTLNKAAFNVATLVAGGHIDQGDAESMLMTAAMRSGLSERESAKSIESGFKAGMAKPRDPEKTDKHDKSDKSDKSDPTRQYMTENDTNMTKHDRNMTENDTNMTGEITDWVKNSDGWFTSAQVDVEFCIRDREKKQLRSNILNNLVKTGELKKDRQVKGRFCRVSTDVPFIDLDAVEESDFPINLPFGLQDMVSLPSGIAVLAGSSNAGKTAFLLELLRINFEQTYPLLYLMSEMGPSEFKKRIRLFGIGIEPWKRVLAAPKASGFDQVIKHHNPDGLTMVDYLEEVDGEYFKINSHIRDIYDSIGNGFCWVGIQKRAESTFARGGEATQEKARIYLTLDPIIQEPGAVICALKIVKAKCYKAYNPNGMERHFRLIKGARFEPINAWGYYNQKDREKFAREAMASIQFNVGGSYSGPDVCPF